MEPMVVLSVPIQVNRVHAQLTESGHLPHLTQSDPRQIHTKQSRMQYKKEKL